jgi:hypothetical protein
MESSKYRNQDRFYTDKAKSGAKTAQEVSIKKSSSPKNLSEHHLLTSPKRLLHRRKTAIELVICRSEKKESA